MDKPYDRRYLVTVARPTDHYRLKIWKGISGRWFLTDYNVTGKFSVNMIGLYPTFEEAIHAAYDPKVIGDLTYK